MSADQPPSPGNAGILQTFREMPMGARFVLLGVFVNHFAAFIQLFLVLYLTDRGFSSREAGFALGVYAIGAIFGVIVGGGASDWLGPRWAIVLSTGSAALFTLSITMLDNYVAILIMVALAGAMTQAWRPAASALLFGLVPEQRRVMAFAMYRTALSIGAIGGPLVAAWLSTISWDLVFWADATAALAYCAIAVFLLPGGRLAEPVPEDQEAKLGRRSSYVKMLRDYRYVAYLALMLANGLVHVQFFVVLPLMLKDANYPTTAYATATAVSAGIVVCCELLVTKWTQTWATWIAVIAGWTLLVIGRSAFGLPGGMTIILIATGLAAVGQIIGGPAAFAYPAKAAPPGLVGRYIGSAHAMFNLGYTLGPIIGVGLWLDLGRWFWAVIFVFGILMIGPGIWSMRPGDLGRVPVKAPPSGEQDPADSVPPDTAPLTTESPAGEDKPTDLHDRDADPARQPQPARSASSTAN